MSPNRLYIQRSYKRDFTGEYDLAPEDAVRQAELATSVRADVGGLGAVGEGYLYTMVGGDYGVVEWPVDTPDRSALQDHLNSLGYDSGGNQAADPYRDFSQKSYGVIPNPPDL